MPDELLVPTLETFKRWQQERGVDYAQLTLDWEAGRGTWNRLHYTQTSLQTVWLRVPPKAELLWKGMAEGCHRAVRKAESKGVEVAEVFDPQLLNTCMDMTVDVSPQCLRSFTKPHGTLCIQLSAFQCWPRFERRGR